MSVETTYAIYNRVDPTRTTALRDAFARDMQRRFTELARVVMQAVWKEDCFGLGEERVLAMQMTTPGAGAFAFPLSKDKMAAFELWLRDQIERGLLTIGELEQLGFGFEERWTDRYVLDSYKRGVMRARTEMQKAGMDVPGVDKTGGIEISMSTPFHIDRLGLLYARVFTDLKGITEVMDVQISRVLAQGIADGDGPALLARKLVAVINGTGAGDLAITDTLGRYIPAQRRAELLARTEVIRAHHTAMVQEYRNWAVEDVMVMAEFITAGDNRVCAKCEGLEGNLYTLDEGAKLIPVHPLCRCILLPFVEGVSKPFVRYKPIEGGK